MRTFSATFLLFVLLLPLSGEYVWLSLKKMTVKSQLKHRMVASKDKDEFMLLKFSTQEAAENLDWEHDAEFEYRGEMYDVIHATITADSATYWVWWDTEETQLNNELKLLVDQILTSASNQSEHGLVVKFQLSQNYTIPDLSELPAQIQILPKNWKVDNQQLYKFLFSYQNTPPPRA